MTPTANSAMFSLAVICAPAVSNLRTTSACADAMRSEKNRDAQVVGDAGDIDIVLDADCHTRQRTLSGGTARGVDPSDDAAQRLVENASGRAAADSSGGPTCGAAQDALPTRNASVASSSTVHESVSTTTP